MSLARLGWHGKLPSAGDFVTGGKAVDLTAGMERWFFKGMAAIRAGGGPVIDAFLTAPLFRFATARDIFGARAGIGVIGPGMDRSGRIYPFAIFLECSVPLDPALTLSGSHAWFRAAERIFLSALDPGFHPARFDATLADLPEPGLTEGEGTPRALFACADGERLSLTSTPDAEALHRLFLPGLLDKGTEQATG